MPFVHIHLIRGAYTPAQIREIADTIQSVLESHFNAPDRDRYQIVSQHEPYEIMCLDTNLGLERSDKLVFIQIFQQGRSQDTKQKTYKELFDQLSRKMEIGAGDLIVTCSANEKDDWSFGSGEAQFLTGAL